MIVSEVYTNGRALSAVGAKTQARHGECFQTSASQSTIEIEICVYNLRLYK